VELLSVSESADEINKVCESIQTFLDSNKDYTIQEQVYLSVQKIAQQLGPKHLLLKTLVGLAKSVHYVAH
jgi:hypothetical protein